MSSELLKPITKKLLEPLFERRDSAAGLREKELEEEAKRFLPKARRGLYDHIAKCISNHRERLEFKLAEGCFPRVRDRLLEALAAEINTAAPGSAVHYPPCPAHPTGVLVVLVERLQ